ncbi:hypothetical protein GE061_012823 [Apolygus lucorum]|uniref:Uncharacterized protein n=1 Tax=Apolygus lucorum TaxID=248454 RepID=A0A6A4JMB6_APOLU|nr:hypothetical protein GE061_012823 [Apolygus lucorum]
MYFPEYNAILVPAESISPDYLPSTKRRKPIRGLVKIIEGRMKGATTSGESSENASVASHSTRSGLAADSETADINKTETESGEEVVNEPKRPVPKPDDFLSEEEPVPTTTVQPQLSSQEHQEQSQSIQEQVIEQNENPQSVQPSEKFFQRPNRPFFGTPVQQAPDIGQDGLPVPSNNRPSLVSFLPPQVTSYFQNPPKIPFSSFLENRFPTFFTPVVAPRNPYIHYYTKTPTSEAFYYNSIHPTMRQAAYSDAVQSEISEYVNQVQQSILQEQEISNPSSSNSAMMVASVPMGKNQATSLLLRPVAKAVAGPKGVAVASPVAKAVLRKGEKVDIDFDPDAVAIAGPGGQAHAHPKLIISYTNEKSDDSSENISS